jgi:uncharacterized protein YeaO (DUF488 family)
MIGVERVYDARKQHPRGKAFLVDRAWPRGVSKDDLSFATWVKEAGPSTELRKWFGHDPKRWKDFQRRYRAELDSDPSVADPIVNASRNGDVTLLYGAKDTEHNQAIVLRDWLSERS